MKWISWAGVLKVLMLLITALVLYTGLVVRDGFSRTETLLAYIDKLEQSGLKPSDLTDRQLEDLLTVEDPAFYQHNGIDLATPGAGITTITQGLVKIHYFEKFKPGLAKYKQSVLALVMDSEIPKEGQLVLLLNTARLGHYNGQRVAGFENAAQVYFNKPFQALTNEEYLALVAMLIGPAQYNVIKKPDTNSERVTRIKRLLAGECRASGLRDVLYSACG